jgi:co-chaperonin GroES (HSP10)
MNNVYFKPVGKRVLVKREMPEQTAFKISDTIQKETHPDIGVVVVIGKPLDEKGKKEYDRLVEAGVAVGVKVCFTRFSPVAIRHADLEHLFIDYENILGVGNR